MRWLLLWGCRFLLLSLAYSNSCLWSLWCLEMSQFTTLLVYLERTFIRLVTSTILSLTELWSSVTIFLLLFIGLFLCLSKPLFFHFSVVFIKTFILSFCSGVWINSSSHDKNVQPRSQLSTTCYCTGGSRSIFFLPYALGQLDFNWHGSCLYQASPHGYLL